MVSVNQYYRYIKHGTALWPSLSAMSLVPFNKNTETTLVFGEHKTWNSAYITAFHLALSFAGLMFYFMSRLPVISLMSSIHHDILFLFSFLLLFSFTILHSSSPELSLQYSNCSLQHLLIPDHVHGADFQDPPVAIKNLWSSFLETL